MVGPFLSLIVGLSFQGSPDPVTRLNERIDQLVKRHSGERLYVRHLRSVQALVRQEEIRSAFLPKPEESRKELHSLVLEMLKGLNGLAANPDSYRHGRTMVIAYPSRQDNLLSYFTLRLPVEWKEGQAVPLLVDLHGAGPSHPLFYPMIHFGPMPPETLKMGPQDDYDRAAVIMPWGRGNAWYRNAAEIDVFEAMEEAQSIVKVDPNRVGLMGHSMGGGGAWSLAIRYPDRWSAVCLQAGLDFNVPSTSPLVENAVHLPMRIWCGEKDGLIEMAKAMHAGFTRAGGKSELVTDPEADHTVPPKAARANALWVLKHQRKRPERFLYRMDHLPRSRTWTGGDPNGAWGIYVDPSLKASIPAEFDARIEGNTLHLNVRYAEKVRIRTGSEGLGIQGDVRIVLNGKEVANEAASNDFWTYLLEEDAR